MVFGPFYEFYQQMTNPMYNGVTDVYALMFLCDFIAFIIIVFGYTSFGPAVSPSILYKLHCELVSIKQNILYILYITETS